MDALHMPMKNINLVLQKCKKLYLDPKTADVKFVFKDSDETIPALKSILYVDSPVFDVMFYGSLPEKGDILIADASPEAFKEFLQFFYLHEFQLTSVNIFQVANLCKKYEVIDALKLCEDPMKMSLNINNMCSGYALASLLEMENVIKYCEQQIKQEASEVLKSAEFLTCGRKLLDKILEILSPECAASVIVDACMAWAKTKCQQQNLDETSNNLKAQFKDLFDRIPFTELEPEQFSQHTKAYKRFFVEDELEAMLLKTMSKRSKKSETTSSTRLAPRILECNRRIWTFRSNLSAVVPPMQNSFTSNTKLMLKELTFAAFAHIRKTYNTTATLYNHQSGKSLDLGTFEFEGGKEMRFILPYPVIIDQNIKHAINFKIHGQIVYRLFPTNSFEFEGGVKIRFDDGPSLISNVIFQELGA